MIEITYPNKAQGEIIQRSKDQLEFLQALVGGYIEWVPGCPPDLDVICNEEGIAMRLGWNKLASERFGRRLLGPVVVLSGKDRLK